VPTGCNGEEEFKIASFGASRLKAEPGDSITLRWTYQEEDQLEHQKLKFLTLTFTGIEEEEISLGTTQREYEFSFAGPIDIMLVATAEEGGDQAALTIQQIQDFYLHMNVSNSDPLRPDLGYGWSTSSGGGCSGAARAYSGSQHLEFTKFFAFYDDQENHVVDDVAGLLPSDKFFRALSVKPVETAHFGMEEGSAYPWNVYGNIDGGVSNTVLFGGVIVTDGEGLGYKAKEGEGTARRGVTEYQRVFVAIVLWIDFSAQTGNVIDVQLGNLDQGLVVTAAYNLLGSSTSVGARQFSYYGVGTSSGTMKGWIKNAVLGRTITRASGDIESVFVDARAIEFNMPMLPDTKIDQFLD